jgi:hypothetical protein
MSAELEAHIRELKDRQEIYDCLMRYCRGVDRADRELLASVYHPDAIDDHGDYVGPASGFIDWVLAFQERRILRSQHMITNHLCDLDGDVAHAESYFLTRNLLNAEPFHTTSSGRYVDRFEKRGGRWAIAARVCLVEMLDGVLDPRGQRGDGPYQPVRRDRSDPSYRRPLTIDPSRFKC